MIGNLFAGTDESPGELILFQGAATRNTAAWGRSRDAPRQPRPLLPGRVRILEGGRGTEKLVPEGIEGRVAHKGSLAAMIHQLVGGLRAGMGYCGSATIPELQRKAKLIRITAAGARRATSTTCRSRRKRRTTGWNEWWIVVGWLLVDGDRSGDIINHLDSNQCCSSHAVS